MSRPQRRWHRLVIPFGVLALVAAVTVLARVAEEPWLNDPDTLAPHTTTPDGSRALAEMLEAEGAQIEYVTAPQEAAEALSDDPDAVLFLPKPTSAGARLVWGLSHRSADHRVVMVAPGRLELRIAGLPVDTAGSRWASRPAEPGCTVPEAVDAGTAAALQRRYATQVGGEVCYEGGLVRTSAGGGQVFVVGSHDPFRNRRLQEHGNAALARGLLGTHDRVVWAGALPSEPVPPLQADPPSVDAPERSELDRSQDNLLAPLLAGYPSGVLAALLLAAVAVVLVAGARARRLGPPVTEPLPVDVPAAETVLGRGLLYRRTRDRRAALDALRAHALPRVLRALGLPEHPPPGPETVVPAVAARTGLDPGHVHRTLYGPAPERDDALPGAAAQLDALVAAVCRDHPAQGGTS